MSKCSDMAYLLTWQANCKPSQLRQPSEQLAQPHNSCRSQAYLTHKDQMVVCSNSSSIAWVKLKLNLLFQVCYAVLYLHVRMETNSLLSFNTFIFIFFSNMHNNSDSYLIKLLSQKKNKKKIGLTWLKKQHGKCQPSVTEQYGYKYIKQKGLSCQKCCFLADVRTEKQPLRPTAASLMTGNPVPRWCMEFSCCQTVTTYLFGRAANISGPIR